MNEGAVIRLPVEMDHQAPIIASSARHKVVVAGRRFGKTTTALIAAVDGHGPLAKGIRIRRGAVDGGKVWWVVPYYHVAQEAWEVLKVATFGVAQHQEQGHRIVLPNGGSVQVKSADNPDSLVAVGLDGAVLDEAAKMKPQAWQILRPALADFEGWTLNISTPKGMNWFRGLHERAVNRSVEQPNEWAAWQRPTWDNPLIAPSEIQTMREEMGPLEFAQEVEAQFVSAGRGMFHPEWARYYRIEMFPAGPKFWLSYLDEQRVVDLAECWKFSTMDPAFTTKQDADYTCLSTWAVTPQHDLLLLDCIRRRVEGPELIPAMQQTYEKWHPSFIGVEATAAQLMIVQMAIQQGLPVKKLTPDKDKVARAHPATARMEQGKVWFPADQPWTRDLEDELWSFPLGEHDDFVDTLSYAVAEQTKGSNSVGAAIPISMERESPWRS